MKVSILLGEEGLKKGINIYQYEGSSDDYLRKRISEDPLLSFVFTFCVMASILVPCLTYVVYIIFLKEDKPKENVKP